MNKTDLAREALAAFDHVVASSGQLRPRYGQRLMAEQVACTLAEADLGRLSDESGSGPVTEPARAIAVIQAGTGVGKSLAYSAPAIALALARNTRVMISTATVTLQEQLVDKDLPALAALMPQPFRFALAKGRGRYVCKLKLERLNRQAAGLAEDLDDEPPEEDDLFASVASDTARHDDQSQRQAVYAAMSADLAHGRWDGDRDTLAIAPDPLTWQTVAADVSSCSARHCPSYGECSYFLQRKALVGAQVIVVNHDLLLSSLGSRALPELDNCLLVLDEAHHLPATALDQFASHMDLSRLAWLDRLSSRALKAGTQLDVEEVADIPKHAAGIRQAIQDLARLVMHRYGDALKTPGLAWNPMGRVLDHAGRARVNEGRLPEPMATPLAQLAHSSQVYIDALRAISKALRSEMRDQPGEARRLATQYAQLGALAPRLEAVHATTRWLMQTPDEGGPPVAKWFTLQGTGERLMLHAHASPTLPGGTLRHHLWNSVRGAVLTSATLTSGGQFDFLLREMGLADDPAVVTLSVPSPFDFSRQGRLVLGHTRADPKDASLFTPEMVQALIGDLQAVRHGALVLFTSREQMRLATEALPADLRPRVLVQNETPRQKLLQLHAKRVTEGLPSIIFGMQSFGEGLDLPGRLCEDLFITKLPFMPPDDPVSEARAEWLRATGRDPFMELVVPATAIRLAQWVGRAIRTEEDEAHVYCYDRRLTQTRYGQHLLAGLPPFTRVYPAAAASV
jgi:ATP-dependent DNA helicase DinG